MSNERRFGEESAAVQSHLSIIQSVIQRMATSSASCKAWCITLVAAILVVVANEGAPRYALIALIPTILFLALDGYYLALERAFRESYNSFITKLHDGHVSASDLYAVAPDGFSPKSVARAMQSFSIWPFYATLAAMIVISLFIITPCNK